VRSKILSRMLWLENTSLTTQPTLPRMPIPQPKRLRSLLKVTLPLIPLPMKLPLVMPLNPKILPQMLLLPEMKHRRQTQPLMEQPPRIKLPVETQQIRQTPLPTLQPLKTRLLLAMQQMRQIPPPTPQLQETKPLLPSHLPRLPKDLSSMLWK